MNEPAARPHRPTLAAWARSLLARFDGAVLRVEPLPVSAAAAVGMGDAALKTACAPLQAWCFAGAGDGRSPFGRPWALPRVPQRFTVASLAPGAEQAQAVEAFSRHLDGSDQLAEAGGRVAGLGLRLRVKLNDALAWRARQLSDPWDAGYLIGELQDWQGFQPRRATLIVADGGLSDEALRDAVRVLHANSAGYRHPVRLLVMGQRTGVVAGSGTSGIPLAITEIAWSSAAIGSARYRARASINTPSATNTL